ncbi:hypothetical protein [Streptomyces sp. NPDC006551]|uniref:hypothetical protein n=1 Tax=Streptomyces sp. NPDC006551 TaxID=3157178 RepID=UPI0033B7C5A4
MFEVVGRAVNEALAGRAGSVDVALTPDDGVRVPTTGPGVPVEAAGDSSGPGLETLLTLPYADIFGTAERSFDLCRESGAGRFGFGLRRSGKPN